MADVLLAGCVIGYGRVATSLPVAVEAGGWCFLGGGLMAVLARATIDRRAVWRRIAVPPSQGSADGIACIACNLAPAHGRRCPRCDAPLRRRKPFALMRTNALLLAAFLLLPVANYFPASTLWEAGRAHPHTIFDGVRLLFARGYAPVGVLIFCTSIALPLVKLLVLTWFLVSARLGSRRALLFRTRLYRAMSNLGRWSNIDPFTVMIFVPMVQFGSLARIDIGMGAPAFLAVIVISMIAIRLFDPRLMWDAVSGTETASPVARPVAPHDGRHGSSGAG
jgi:paraquat-inducible protein A